MRGAALNVRVNARSLSDPARAWFFRATVAAWEDEARHLVAEIVQFANDSTG